MELVPIMIQARSIMGSAMLIYSLIKKHIPSHLLVLNGPLQEYVKNLKRLLSTVTFVWSLIKKFVPHRLPPPFGAPQAFAQSLGRYLSTDIEVTFYKYAGDSLGRRNELYVAIERYLSSKISSAEKGTRIRARSVNKSIMLTMENDEEVIDEFNGIEVLWRSNLNSTTTDKVNHTGKRYTLTFHKRYRQVIMNDYMNYIQAQSDEIAMRTRQRKIYTNSKEWGPDQRTWSATAFEHPVTFDTLAMDAEKKKEIIDDLITFTKAKDYYKRIGKSWKRGYLLYGPPGTGKSSMIAAMSNLLQYDIYDLELSSVRSNMELRRLLINTSSKSIIVIEDIDCSVDLTGKRNPKPRPVPSHHPLDQCTDPSVTLSGLLNFMDGLWSALGSEKIIVFTSNHVDKLDPALIRRGRMDKHILMSFCRFEEFKVLAKNYLDIELHDLFASIGRLLEETDMTPADVAENLMPKCPEDNADKRLENLVQALMETKEKAKRKAEEEAKKEKEMKQGALDLQI